MLNGTFYNQSWDNDLKNGTQSMKKYLTGNGPKINLRLGDFVSYL